MTIMTTLVKYNKPINHDNDVLSRLPLNSNSIKCYFCNGNHACRECPLEAKMAPVLRKKVGNMMEYYIAENLKCPECKQWKTLKVIGNHTPSLDIICSCCHNKFEVKSKCLSVAKLPTDINLPHGSYIDYVHRLDEGLNLIVIIYGVERVKKLITVREVIYANNQQLRSPAIVEVLKRTDNNLSTIMIKNKKVLTTLELQTDDTVLTFKNDVETFKGVRHHNINL
jgi:hypothetical protein